MLYPWYPNGPKQFPVIQLRLQSTGYLHTWSPKDIPCHGLGDSQNLHCCLPGAADPTSLKATTKEMTGPLAAELRV